tara:strand:- start:42 stop:485 length:444 start_codon:yes stop_codon:yes gene_type:complete
MIQGELFDIVKEVCEEGIVCIKCNVRQPIGQFNVMKYDNNSDKPTEIKRTCRSCNRDHSRLLKDLKRKHAYPNKEYSCPICERNLKEISKHGQKRLQGWVLDHCHDTRTFRGWLCHHCNTGLGGFSDKLERLSNAVAYLQNHKEKHK